MSWRAVSGVAVALILSACTAPGLDQGSSDDADDDNLRELTGGVDATDADFPSTINVTDCSGAKVGPNRILTAAHCIMTSGQKVFSARLNSQRVWISSAPKPLNADSSRIVSQDPRTGFLPVRITGVYIDDSFVAGRFYPDGIDLAVLVVADEDVAKIASIPVAPVDVTPVAVGTAVALTGYGCDNGAGKPNVAPNHRKYQKTRTVEGLTNAPNYMFTAWKDADPSSATTCPGDSGGPLYRLDASGAPAGIVGLNALSAGNLNYAARTSGTWLAQAVDGTLAPRPIDAFGMTCLGGAGTVVGEIRTKYVAMGGCTGDLGAPTSDEGQAQGGRFNDFSNGSIYWTSSGGAHAVVGENEKAWAASGWEKGPLGFPTADTAPTTDGGSFTTFEKGVVYASPTTGAHAVYGKILEKWRELGLEKGDLGYPTKDEYAVTEGRRSDFQHGTITWNAAQNEAVVVVQGR